ncbi:MAG TPA: hypothetical protein VEH31_28215 [Streptosporangiaceae bacterium]|nr:hypothetical protein [Streptosporangiaceae bacterium]
MISATLEAPAGTPVQASGIGVLLPRQENLTGIIVPAANAGLRTVIAVALAGAVGPAAVLAGGLDAVDPPPDPLQAASRRAASTVSAPTAAWPRLDEN